MGDRLGRPQGAASFPSQTEEGAKGRRGEERERRRGEEEAAGQKGESYLGTFVHISFFLFLKTSKRVNQIDFLTLSHLSVMSV